MKQTLLKKPSRKLNSEPKRAPKSAGPQKPAKGPSDRAPAGKPSRHKAAGKPRPETQAPNQQARGRKGAAARHAPPQTQDTRPAVGQKVVLEIAELTLAGEAIGRLGGYVVFVRGALPGEKVRVEITSTGRRYGRAKVLDVVKPAPTRVPARCQHFGTCGRCSLQHVSYPEQLRMKERLLRSALEHGLPGVHLPMRPMIGMDNPWATRNKAHFVLGTGESGPALGHYEAHSRQVIPIRECPVHDENANRVAASLLKVLNERRIPVYDESLDGIARDVIVRVSQKSGQTHAMLVASDDHLPQLRGLGEALMALDPSVAGVHLNLNPGVGPVVIGDETTTLAGKAHLEEEIAGVKYLISPTSFFQTNPQGALRLVETVLRNIPTGAKGPILDLYCGVGLFSLHLAKRGHRVVAVEENPQSVSDAIASAELNGVTGCEFHAGKSEKVLKKLSRDEKFEAVVLDPPREGCPDWAVRLICRGLRPERIVDVSCEPGGLIKDLQILTQSGYRIVEIQPIDMFPQTMHIETVATLQRMNKKR